MRRFIAFVAYALAIAAGASESLAQCTITASSISPKLIGRTLNPATTFARIAGNVADGDLIRIDTGGTNRGYEFDTNSSVTAGNVPVPLTAVDNVSASRALAAAINGDALAPIIAQAIPIGATDQYIGFAWKSDSGYSATNSNPVNANGTISVNNFSYQGNGYNWLLISGTNLNLTSTVKLVNVADNSRIANCTIAYRPASGSVLGFNVTVTQLNSNPLPLGAYNVVITRTGCPDVILPAAVTLVENLINDPTFVMGSLGNTIPLFFQGTNFQLPAVWQNNNVNDPDPNNPLGNYYEAVRKGSPYFPVMPDGTTSQVPRQFPFPTGANHTNFFQGGTGDGDWGSLRWYNGDGGSIPDNNTGRHQMWQEFDINLPQTSFVTVSGLWAGGSDVGDTLSYGIEIRDGDENGPILAQTPLQHDAERWDWRSFSHTLSLPGGPHHVAFVIHGTPSIAGKAALHFDDLLLAVGADFWPDLDDDGDVDMDDFAGFQRCYTGAGGTLPANPMCPQLDRDGDNDVDEVDFNAFNACTTRAGVPLDPNQIPPGCTL